MIALRNKINLAQIHTNLVIVKAIENSEAEKYPYVWVEVKQIACNKR